MISTDVMKKVALFVGGTLFGTAGVKILSSQDAKKAYVHAAAAALRAKDCVMDVVASVQENADDILAEAQEINERRAAQEVYEDEEAQEAQEEENKEEQEDSKCE